MKLKLSPDQIRFLWKPEVQLAFILLVAFVAWVYVDGKASDAEAELLAATNSRTIAESDLSYWTTSFNQSALREELKELQAVPKAPGLPTLEEALAFRGAFVAYTSDNQIPLRSLEVLNATVDGAGSQLPAVRYSMVVNGNLASLVGALQIFESFPTASVQAMVFSQDEVNPETWNLGFTLDVVHQPEEA